MRQKVRNVATIEIRGVDLNDFTNLKCFVEQDGTEYSFDGTVDPDNEEHMLIDIPKTAAMHFKDGHANLQVAMTDADGVPLVYEPIDILIGKLLWRSGYGE